MHLYSKDVAHLLSIFISEWMGPFLRRAYRLRESSLSQMIYRVSGLDEPPLDVSPTPVRVAIRQCRLQYTEPYVGSRASRTEAKALPRHSGGKFSSLYIKRIPLCHYIQWEDRGIFKRGDLSLSPYIVAEVVSCPQIGQWIMWLTWEDRETAKNISHPADKLSGCIIFRQGTHKIAVFICLTKILF